MTVVSLISEQRTKTLFGNIAASFSGRALNLLSTIVSIPIAVHALGPGRYGLLAVVLSLTTFFTYADLGLGVAIVNEVAGANGKNDDGSAQRAITQVWVMLWTAAFVIIAIALLVALSGLVPKILPGVSVDEAAPVWLTLAVGSALGIPFAISQRVMFALQMGMLAQAWATAGRIGVVLAALGASIATPSLVAFIVVFAGVPVIFAALCTIHLFGRLKPELCPSLRAFALEGLRTRVAVGLKFSLLQLSNFVETGIDPLLMAHFFSATIITQFDLVARLFGYVPALASIALSPLWPALSHALHSNDRVWFKTAYHHMQIAVIALSACAAVAAVFSCESIIALWTGVSLHLNGIMALKVAMGLWVVANAASVLQGVVLNAFGQIGSQAAIALGVVITVLPIKLIFYSVGSLSMALFSMVLIYLVKQGIQLALIRRSDRSIFGSKQPAAQNAPH